MEDFALGGKIMSEKYNTPELKAWAIKAGLLKKNGTLSKSAKTLEKIENGEGAKEQKACSYAAWKNHHRCKR